MAHALDRLLSAGASLPSIGTSALMETEVLREVPRASRAQRLLDLLKRAVAEIDSESDWHAAASVLFGLTPGSFRKPLAERRARAADAFFVTPHTFRRDYEHLVVEEVAWRLAYALEVEIEEREAFAQLALFEEEVKR